MTHIMENEFWKIFGLFLAGRLEGRVGTLWDSKSKEPDGILQNYKSHMTRIRFNEVHHYMAFVFADKTKKGGDDLLQVLGEIDGLNENWTEKEGALNL